MRVWIYCCRSVCRILRITWLLFKMKQHIIELSPLACQSTSANDCYMTLPKRYMEKREQEFNSQPDVFHIRMGEWMAFDHQRTSYRIAYNTEITEQTHTLSLINCTQAYLILIVATSGLVLLLCI